jgi:hypothetical protein
MRNWTPPIVPTDWAEDVSEDVALEILRRVDELPSSIEAFIEMHAGPSRQLSLRLN